MGEFNLKNWWDTAKDDTLRDPEPNLLKKMLICINQFYRIYLYDT